MIYRSENGVPRLFIPKGITNGVPSTTEPANGPHAPVKQRGLRGKGHGCNKAAPARVCARWSYNGVLTNKQNERQMEKQKRFIVGDKVKSAKGSTMAFSGIRTVAYVNENGFLRLNGDHIFMWNPEHLEKVEDDNVNHPPHYTSHPSRVECIEITRHYCFAIGNAIKYLWRAGLKQDADKDSREKEIEDLQKAVWYINNRIEQLKGE